MNMGITLCLVLSQMPVHWNYGRLTLADQQGRSHEISIKCVKGSIAWQWTVALEISCTSDGVDWKHVVVGGCPPTEPLRPVWDESGQQTITIQLRTLRRKILGTVVIRHAKDDGIEISFTPAGWRTAQPRKNRTAIGGIPSCSEEVIGNEDKKETARLRAYGPSP